MAPRFFLRLIDEEAEWNPTLPTYVATDELDRTWFAPIAEMHNISFLEGLAQKPLLAALTPFPQSLWADVRALA